MVRCGRVMFALCLCPRLSRRSNNSQAPRETPPVTQTLVADGKGRSSEQSKRERMAIATLALNSRKNAPEIRKRGSQESIISYCGLERKFGFNRSAHQKVHPPKYPCLKHCRTGAEACPTQNCYRLLRIDLPYISFGMDVRTSIPLVQSAIIKEMEIIELPN